MILKFYTLRGRHSGRLYYATGFNMLQASKELGISIKDLILERSEVMPAQAQLPLEPSTISRHTAQYHRPLKGRS